MNFKFGQYIQGVHPNPLKISEKRERGRIQGLPNFFGYPLLSRSRPGKATNFKFCMYIYRLNRNKSPLKMLRKVAMSVVRDSRKFSGHPYVGRIARSSLRQLSFLVLVLAFTGVGKRLTERLYGLPCMHIGLYAFALYDYARVSRSADG